MAAEVVGIKAFVRRMVIQNPGVPVPEVIAAWEATGKTGGVKVTPNHVHSARYDIKGRYGLKDIADIPKREGKPDPLGLAVLLHKKNPDTKCESVQKILEQDGLHLTIEEIMPLLGYGKTNPKPNQQILDAVNNAAKPAPGTEPRARHLGGRKHGDETKVTDTQVPNNNTPEPVPADPKSVLFAQSGLQPVVLGAVAAPATGPTDAEKVSLARRMSVKLEEMEDQITDIIDDATVVLDSGVVQRLKKARRYVTASLAVASKVAKVAEDEG